MRSGRPRIPIGSHGTITTRREGSRTLAETRVRDLDGRVRQVRVFAPTVTAAQNLLKERIRDRPVMPGSGVLQQTSSFTDLADVWLADSTCATWRRTPRRATAAGCVCTCAQRSSTTPR